MNVIVSLDSSIASFHLNDSLFSKLEAAFSNWKFTRAHSDETFLQELPGADIVIVWKFLSSWYDHAPSLKAIFTPAAGKDWIASSTKSNIPIFHGTFHGYIMAESLLAMMLYFNRNFPQLLRNQQEQRWDPHHLSETHMLAAQHAVIIGYGSIGKECARILKTFGMRITGIRRSPRTIPDDKHADHLYPPSALFAVLPQADHIVGILPGGPETTDIISREHFSAMKKGVYFYNIGRGNCYSEKDLLWALSEGIIAGAGLDVFAQEPLPQHSPLWHRNDVLVMPHASAICKEYLPLYIDELIGLLRAYR